MIMSWKDKYHILNRLIYNQEKTDELYGVRRLVDD